MRYRLWPKSRQTRIRYDWRLCERPRLNFHHRVPAGRARLTYLYAIYVVFIPRHAQCLFSIYFARHRRRPQVCEKMCIATVALHYSLYRALRVPEIFSYCSLFLQLSGSRTIPSLSSLWFGRAAFSAAPHLVKIMSKVKVPEVKIPKSGFEEIMGGVPHDVESG